MKSHQVLGIGKRWTGPTKEYTHKFDGSKDYAYAALSAGKQSGLGSRTRDIISVILFLNPSSFSWQS